MQIDFGSISFNCHYYTTEKNKPGKKVGGNASWTTAVSKQNKDYKFNLDNEKTQGFFSLLSGMIYCSIPVNSITGDIGKGGNKADEHEFILASKFNTSIITLYIENKWVTKQIKYPFLMLLSKSISEAITHCGTKTLRFGESLRMLDGSCNNRYFFQNVISSFGMTANSSWVIEHINIDNQDTIHLYGVVIDKHKESPIYDNADSRKIIVQNLRPAYPFENTNSSFEIESENIIAIEPKIDGVDFDDFDYALMAAAKTKPFIIIGGFSGTGKSQKIKELAFSTCICDGRLNTSETSPGNYLLVSVKPNWHDATDITGFRSSVNRNYYVTDFMRFLVKAKIFDHNNKPSVPFFVCLDEMNLAPVEEYFADFLSVIESRKKRSDGKIVTDAIVPASVFNDTDYADDFNIFLKLGLKPAKEVKDITEFTAEIKNDGNESDFFEESWLIDELKTNGLTIPGNVVIIGTVNMDDTTNSFSRKVIDRAMTFETVVGKFNETYFDSDVTLNYVKRPYKSELFISDEVRATQMLDDNVFTLTEGEKINILGFINNINSDLEGSPFKISYRILNETILLYRAKQKIAEIMNEEGGFEEGIQFNTDLNSIFDDILMQKVLPRIEGDYEKCNKCLVALSIRAEDNNWTKSLEKIDFMIKRFGKDKSGFTSFWN